MTTWPIQGRRRRAGGYRILAGYATCATSIVAPLAMMDSADGTGKLSFQPIITARHADDHKAPRAAGGWASAMLTTQKYSVFHRFAWLVGAAVIRCLRVAGAVTDITYARSSHSAIAIFAAAIFKYLQAIFDEHLTFSAITRSSLDAGTEAEVYWRAFSGRRRRPA